MVSASPSSPAVSEDFIINSNKTLTIAAGQTSSTGPVTITGIDNRVDAPDKSVTVSAAVSGGLGVTAPSSRTLTITDDDTAPTVTLDLSPSSISENGGSSGITASLSAPSTAMTTVTVSAALEAGADPGDYSLRDDVDDSAVGDHKRRHVDPERRGQLGGRSPTRQYPYPAAPRTLRA